MRVMVFLPSAAIGGAERMTFTLVNHLRRAGGEPLLVLGQGGPLRREVSADVPVVELEVTRMRYAVVRLARLIRRWQPDVVFAAKPNASIALTGAWWLSGRRAALVLRESNFRSANGSAQGGLFPWILGWCYRQADWLVAPSRGVGDDLLKRYALSRGRLRIIYNPIDHRRIRAAVDLEGGHHDGTTRLLAVGRLIPQKGFDVLLQAMARLNRRDVRLTIVGDGPEHARLRHLAEELGIASRVTMAGFVTDPYPTMAEADLLVLPSRWEGFPNALVEAMACGLPVVATRCLAGPEEIITHEHDGLLCDPESPDSLAAALARLLDDRALARRLGANARSTSQRFDAASIAREYATVFRETGATHHGPS